MYRQVGPAQIEDDMMQRGMIVRHLVLPGCVDNSLGVLDWFSEHFHGKGVWFSLMSQYVPMGRAKNMPPFDRHITENEYAPSARISNFATSKTAIHRTFPPRSRTIFLNLICPVYETGRKFPQLDKTNV